jgi:hypothetical protein
MIALQTLLIASLSAAALGQNATAPSNQIIKDRVDSICTEMPGMKDCTPCNTMDTKTCYSFDNYAKLCLDMPDMTQCKEWTAYCMAANKQGPFCDRNASPSGMPMNGTMTSKPSATASATASAKSDAMTHTSALALLSGLALMLL